MLGLPFRTARGALSWLRLIISRKDVVRRGACRRCGRCCTEILLWTNGAWLGGEKDFRRLMRQDPRYERFHIVGRDGDERLLLTCDRLGEDGSCTDYENRMEFCRDYPSREQYLDYGGASEGCGFRFEASRRFAGVLAKAMREADGSQNDDVEPISEDEHAHD